MPQTEKPDAIALLKADHRKVEDLFEQFEKASSSKRKQELAEQICMELTVHAQIEEEIFYPACEGAVEEDLIKEAYVEHDGAKVLIGEIEAGSPLSFHVIAEADGRPIGVMQVCDPHLEPTHYWGEIEPDLRAIDIWIRPPDALNRGYGTQMMTLAMNDAFADPKVKAIVIDPLNTNVDAHRFYQRLGFGIVGRRMFDEDDCLVMRLDRATWEARA